MQINKFGRLFWSVTDLGLKPGQGIFGGGFDLMPTKDCARISSGEYNSIPPAPLYPLE